MTFVRTFVQTNVRRGDLNNRTIIPVFNVYTSKVKKIFQRPSLSLSDQYNQNKFYYIKTF